MEPYTWQGALAADDRIALISRHFAHTVGVDELQGGPGHDATRPGDRAPSAGLHHPRRDRIRRMLAVEVTELASTATTHHLEPVRPAEPFAGLPDQSPVPLADAIGPRPPSRRRRRRRREVGVRSGDAHPDHVDPRLRAATESGVPRSIPRTAEREQGRRRRLGMVGMGVVAGILAVGSTDGRVSPPRARRKRSRAPASPGESIAEADGTGRVRSRSGRRRGPGGPRSRSARSSCWRTRTQRSARAASVGVADEELAPLHRRIDRRLDSLYQVARIEMPRPWSTWPPASTTSARPRWSPPATGRCGSWMRAAAASSRADPADGSRNGGLRAGEALESGQTPGRPMADHDGSDRRRRHRPRADRVAHRPDRTRPAPDAARGRLPTWARTPP